MGAFRNAILLAGALALAALASCSREPQPEVVLYSSVDDPLLRQVAGVFSARTGIKVLLVGDTEATKTTGLVERLLAERSSPRCDVWWSSEPLGTLRLAREGLIQHYKSGPAEARFPDGWPSALTGPRDADGAPEWYGFACRARVIVYDTREIRPVQAPRTLRELAAPAWRGRVGMARPQFGTTRAHVAAIAADCGQGALRSWLEAMAAGGLRLYDGNSAVVRAIAQGEIDAGLTDTDDVWAAQREGWPVAAAFEATDDSTDGLCSPGPMLIPSTVALVKGAPHPSEAAMLIDFLLGAEVELLLASSDSHNLPVGTDLPSEYSAFAVPGGRLPDLNAVEAQATGAMAICRDVLGSP